MTAARLPLVTLLCLTLLRTPLTALMAALLPDVSVAPELNYAASIAQTLLMFALPGWLLTPKAAAPVLERGRLTLWLLIAMGAALLARTAIMPLNDWWTEMTQAGAAAVPAVQGVIAQGLQTLALTVVPAVAEELFFRGALLGSLMRCCGRGRAVLLTTLMFALMHGSAAGLLGHLIISLLLTLLMVHGRSILVPIVAHLIYNLSALVWMQTGMLLPWVCGAGLLALAVWLLLRLPKGEARRMERMDALLCGASLAVMTALYLV